MRRLANAVLCVAMLSTTQLSRATSVDPQISVGDPSSGAALNSSTFSFSSDGRGGGTFNFTNDTRRIWQTMDFFATLPSGDIITCTSTVYSSCDYTATPQGSGMSLFDIGFENPTDTGIAPGESFSIDLNTNPTEDKGGWGANNTIQGVANLGLPEPASWTLAALGLLACGLIAFYGRAA